MRHRTDSAASACVIDERVTVAIGTAIGIEARARITEQRYEEIARPEGARVDADAEYVGSIDLGYADSGAGVAPPPDEFATLLIHRFDDSLSIDDRPLQHSAHDRSSDADAVAFWEGHPFILTSMPGQSRPSRVRKTDG
jgi:hypothetical protein